MLAQLDVDLPLLAPVLLDIPAALERALDERLRAAYDELVPRAKAYGPGPAVAR